MPTPKVVKFDDWSKGDWGELSPYNAPAGSFSGTNVVVYANGFIGPRAGLHENTYTGASMQGNVYGLYHPGRIGKPLIIFAGDDIYSTTENTESLGVVASAGTLDAEPTEPVVATWYDPNGLIYFTSPGDKVYSINWSDNTLTNVPVRNAGADDAGVQTVYLCRDRLYAAGDIPNDFGWRVYISAAADFSNFSGGDYVDVGYFNAVRGIVESQNSLNFATITSANYLGSSVGWYSLVGATPQGSIRRVNTQVAAGKQNEIVNAEDGNFYFWAGFTVADSDYPFLVQSNGVKFNENEFQHIRLAGVYRYGYYNAVDKTLIYVSDSGDTAWMRCNNVWTKHHFEVPVSGPVAPSAPGNSFLLAYGAPSTDVKVYEMLSRPGGPTPASNQSNPGDNSNTPLATCEFELPAYRSEGKEVRVRKVFIDFSKFNLSHAATNNEFTVTVRTFGQYNLPSGSTDGIVETTQTWTEAQTLSDALGTMDRYVVRIGQQGKAQGFQIKISGIKGVMIRSITAEIDEDDPDGRTL